MLSDEYKVKLVSPLFGQWNPDANKKPIVVLMSGGVDSSVCAHLLKEAGWDVVGITMQIPVSCGVGPKGCCGADAAMVANEIGIKHYYVDMLEAFEKLIIEPFRTSYANAETPNPCVDCNTLLKFELVWELIEKEFGIKHVATGHYARVIHEGGQAFLRRGENHAKDQSYFLYGIKAQRLKGFVLPLGEYSKGQIRQIAKGLNLSVAEKAESMELCFAGEGDYRAVLGIKEAKTDGDMLNMEGEKIGTHKGVANYTIGQRRGLGFAGGEPLYVGKIDAVKNTVSLGKREQVSRKVIKADAVNVLVESEYNVGGRLFGKIRSGGEPRACTLVAAQGESMTVEFDEAVFGPSPGQRIVLYDKNENVVCGGKITRSGDLSR